MEKLESLNAIVEEFQIKASTLRVFKISELVLEGKNYDVVAESPRHLETGNVPNFLFEDRDQNFCSIFSDSIVSNESHCTQITESLPNIKLLSDAEILSSDFEPDQGATILTSDAYT